MGSASAFFSHFTLCGRASRNALGNAVKKPPSSRKDFDLYSSLDVRRLSQEKAIEGWTACSSTLVVFAKLGKGRNPGNNGDNKSRYGRPFSSGGSSLRSPVPLEQQPVNEYQNLVESVLFSWAVGDVWSYTLKLSTIGAVVALLLGWPIMVTSLDPGKELFKCGTGALCGGLLAATLAALRMYLGWAYVGNRLFSATVEYEETGWYDGQIWIKPPEVLARDRLLGSYKVKPALNRVKLTLIGLAASLASCTLFFLSLQGTQEYLANVPDDMLGSSSRPVGTAYNEASARLFEPDAFASDGDSMLPDYCH